MSIGKRPVSTFLLRYERAVLDIAASVIKMLSLMLLWVATELKLSHCGSCRKLKIVDQNLAGMLVRCPPVVEKNSIFQVVGNLLAGVEQSCYGLLPAVYYIGCGGLHSVFFLLNKWVHKK